MHDWQAIQEELDELLRAMRAAELSDDRDPAGAPTHPSVRNLLHYEALRRHDLRELQSRLAEAGLSSLGGSEGHVLAALEEVMARVEDAARTGRASAASSDRPVASWRAAESLLHANTRALFGPKPAGRHVYVMVTSPSPHDADDAWFAQQIGAGMNLLRINAAHDRPADWVELVERARRAAAAAASHLRILVDLPGPKIRTAALAEGAKVKRFKPLRDELGRVMKPAHIHFVSEAAFADDASADRLPVPARALERLRPGDRVMFTDARGRSRRLVLERSALGPLVAESNRTSYVLASTCMSVRDADDEERFSFSCPSIPPVGFVAKIALGGCVRLVDERTFVRAEGDLVPTFGCTFPAAVAALAPGDRVLIDDGKIEALVMDKEPGAVVLEVQRAKRGVALVRDDMGLNLPDTTLDVPALAGRDEEALSLLQDKVDLVGLSFVRSAADVRTLETSLRRPDLGLVLKIETRAGFEALPSILRDCIGRRPVAVMIARGDLAVEVGFERLAEVQEEILWFCEAAHVPVIWATQVLESLAKTGFATRAEVTDAAMAVRAECVMLNKGAFIEDAIKALDSILRRMEGHIYKRRQVYRPLGVAKPPAPRH